MCSFCRSVGFFCVLFWPLYCLSFCLSIVTWWVPLVEQELLTLTEHLSSPSVFSGVRVTRSLVLYVYFINRCIVLLSFFFLPLCCQSCLDLQILITSLVSSNSSCSDYDDLLDNQHYTIHNDLYVKYQWKTKNCWGFYLARSILKYLT